MNYRRVLAVLAIAWAVFIFIIVFTDTWQPWPRLIVDFKGGVSEEEKTAALNQIFIVKKWQWATGLAVIPPAILYIFLFAAVRVVRRVPEPGTHN